MSPTPSSRASYCKNPFGFLCIYRHYLSDICTECYHYKNRPDNFEEEK